MTLPQPLILAVFHDVETYVPGKSGSYGVFIVGKDNGAFFFKWSQYKEQEFPSQSPPGSSPNSPSRHVLYCHQIYLTASQIQKIIVTPQEQRAGLLISTLHPPEMHQFQFTQNPMGSCMQFLQVLAVNSFLTSDTKVSGDFWRTTMTNNAITFPSASSLARVYDIECDKGKFNVPFILVSTDSVPLVDEITKAQIASSFGIDGSQYVNSPLSISDFDNIIGSSISFNDIRIQASRRGISPELRSILWPQLLDVLPFSKQTASVLKQRVEEYQKTKKQWQTLSSFQLTRRTELRSAYQTIRMDVRRTNIPQGLDEGLVREMMVNVLRTYAIWNYNIRYTQGINDLLLPFIHVFLTSKHYTNDEVEALSFWCLASFAEKIESSLIEPTIDGILQEDLPFVLSLLKVHDEKVYNWINDCNMSDMNFVVSSFMLAFRRSLDELQLERAWDSVMAADDPHSFVLSLAAALIIFAYPAFSRIDNCSTPVILPLCDKILSQQPIGSVVGVAISIDRGSQKLEKKSNHRLIPIANISKEYFELSPQKNMILFY